MAGNLEASHLFIDDRIGKQEWFIRDPEIEKELMKYKITWKDEKFHNTFHPNARKFIVQLTKLDSAYPVATFELYTMIGNCGGMQWKMMQWPKETQRLLVFIIRNIASYTGQGTIFTSGAERFVKSLEELGFGTAVYNKSSRNAAMMGYIINTLDYDTEVAKKGFNYIFS